MVSDLLTYPPRVAGGNGGAASYAETQAISKQNFPGRTLLQSLLGRLDLEEVAQRISFIDPQRDVEAKNVRRWLTSRPSAHGAWLLGEALRWGDDKSSPFMPQASGLLALYWCGHLDHFVGVIGCIETRSLAVFEARLMAMLRTMEATTYASPYDALPAGHNILTHDADDFLLRQVADTKVIDVPKNISYVSEAASLNERRTALDIWKLPDELHALIVAAAGLWFGRKRSHNEARGSVNASRVLRRASAIARSNINDIDALDLIIDHLSQWFYTTVMPEPPPESIEMIKALVQDPTSATAKALLTGYRSLRLLGDQPLS